MAKVTDDAAQLVKVTDDVECIVQVKLTDIGQMKPTDDVEGIGQMKVTDDKVDQLVEVTNDVGQLAKTTDDALRKLVRMNDRLFYQCLKRCSQKAIVIDDAVYYPKCGIGQFVKETAKLVLLEM